MQFWNDDGDVHWWKVALMWCGMAVLNLAMLAGAIAVVVSVLRYMEVIP